MARVSFDDQGKATLQQLHAHINGELQNSLNRYNQLSNQVVNNPNVAGKWMDDYKSNVYPVIQKNIKQMHEGMAKVNQNLTQHGINIYAAGNQPE